MIPATGVTASLMVQLVKVFGFSKSIEGVSAVAKWLLSVITFSAHSVDCSVHDEKRD